MNRVKHDNPFAMGNLTDLGIAQENNDMEYLKEWSKLAVNEYEKMHGIQLYTYKYLMGLKIDASNAVEKIYKLLSDSSTSTRISEENE